MSETFKFNISLSVLNHLGRNLYRNFITILGEAISNSWDADAKNVYVTVNKNKKYFTIKDDGIGMNAEDFQDKFLKVGYSKRNLNSKQSQSGRPYIGRKGIGKLALLSCSESIYVISKTKDTLETGGVISNRDLDAAIIDDDTTYNLGAINFERFKDDLKDFENGTFIYFENLKESIYNTLEYLRKLIALYFRFSILDKEFKIFFNGVQITNDDLKDLIDKSQFAWIINNHTGEDLYLKRVLTVIVNDEENRRTSALALEIPSEFDKDNKPVKSTTDGITGFIISVPKPRDLTLRGTDQKVSVDLFVNGRVRETAIINHKTTSRIAESYLYGQIHYNALDGDVERFNTSRESIIAEDPKFKQFLDSFYKILQKIVDEWDKFRLEINASGDDENGRIPKLERQSKALFNLASAEYIDNKVNKKLNAWIRKMSSDASFNLSSYIKCFVSENLIRLYIEDNKLPLSSEANKKVKNMKNSENRSKKTAGININIRRKDDDKSYLDMSDLSNLIDKGSGEAFRLSVKAKEYKPVRDALMHTAILSEDAKSHLANTSANIKGRIKDILKEGNS